jgi:hypothetical protein
MRSNRRPPISEGRGGPENWGHSDDVRPPLSPFLDAKDRDCVWANGARSRAAEDTESYRIRSDIGINKGNTPRNALYERNEHEH